MVRTGWLWLVCAVLMTAGGGVLAADAAAAKDAAPSVAASSSQRLPKPTHYADWPAIKSRLPADPALEARVRKIVAGMTLAQKIGQMTQAEIKSITPAEVTTYHIGSVLNGGGSWPGGNKHASIAPWADCRSPT